MRLSSHRSTLLVLLCLLSAPAWAGHYDWFRPNAFDLEGGYISSGRNSAWTTAFSLRADVPFRLIGVGCEYRFMWGSDPLPSSVHQTSSFVELHPLFFIPLLTEHPLAHLPATFYLRAGLGPAWVTRPGSTHRVFSTGYGGGVDVPLGGFTGDRAPVLWLGLGVLVTHLSEFNPTGDSRMVSWSLRLGMHMAP
jgi:hypothetical protein